MRRFWAVFVARNLEFFRDRSTLIFNLIMPVFLIFGFAFAFPAGGGTTYKIGVVGAVPAAGTSSAAAAVGDVALLHYEHVSQVPYEGLEKPLDRLAHHQLDMVVDLGSGEYYVNEASTNGYFLERMLRSEGSSPLAKRTVTGAAIRYVDWFIPGMIGINILFGSLSGVGFVIVRYRRNGVLKRFKATPLRAIEFAGAQVLSRFFIVAFFSALVFLGTDLFLHFRMAGSWLLLVLVNAMAIICMISLGLVFSSRIKSEEVAGGLMNLITWPMMILSGVFFSLEGTPQFMRSLSKIFPITHYVEASRAIMLDGAGLAAVSGNLAVLGAMTAAFLLAAAALFKWE